MLLVLWMNVKREKKRIKLTRHEQVLLLNRLATLLGNGYSLNNALELISFDPSQGHIARKIESELVRGKVIDKVFEEIGFPKIIISFLYFSHSTGKLDECLISCSKLLQQQQQFTAKFKKVIQYPLILFSFFLILFIGLKLFLLPSFQNLYDGFQFSHANGSTQKAFHGINFFINSFLILVSIILFTIGLWKILKPKLPFSAKLKFYEKTPLLKGIKTLEISYLFSYHLSTLLLSGLTTKDSLLTMSQQNHIQVIQQYSNQISQSIYHGKKLFDVLKPLTLLEKELSVIFRRSVNEKSLGIDLYNYAEILVETMTNKMDKILSYIQPMIFLVFGAIIITIYLSILVPMFSMLQQI